MELLLALLLLLCAFSSWWRICPAGRAQAFLLVPSSPQKNVPLITAGHDRCKIWSSKTTALFVRHDPFAINKELVELGKKRRWKELLEVAEQKQASFNNVNYATLMSQLGRIRSFNKQDPRFLAISKSIGHKDRRAGTAVDPEHGRLPTLFMPLARCS